MQILPDRDGALKLRGAFVDFVNKDVGARVGSSFIRVDSSQDKAAPAKKIVGAFRAATLAGRGHTEASPGLPLLEVGLDSLAITGTAMQASRRFDCAELQAGC